MVVRTVLSNQHFLWRPLHRSTSTYPCSVILDSCVVKHIHNTGELHARDDCKQGLLLFGKCRHLLSDIIVCIVCFTRNAEHLPVLLMNKRLGPYDLPMSPMCIIPPHPYSNMEIIDASSSSIFIPKLSLLFQ